tara:strand:+ start:355 stop:534 length:180 start_codon:yes stop_codon:yes gene_type:complete
VDEKSLVSGMLNIIDMSCKRGCWDGSEIGFVSKVRENLLQKMQKDNKNLPVSSENKKDK